MRILQSWVFWQADRALCGKSSPAPHDDPRTVIAARSGTMSRPMNIERVNEYGRNAVRIDVSGNAVLLDAAELDALIERLAVLRATMRPEVPTVPLRSHQYLIEINPCWHTEMPALNDGAVMFLRHSGLGWAGFALPTESLAKLHHALTQHLEASFEVHGTIN
jgi:hypothetical protein